MGNEGRLVYGYQPPIAWPLRSMVYGPMTPVQQHDIPRSQFHTVAELRWIHIRRKQGNGSLCRQRQPSDTGQHFPDVDEPNVRKLRLRLAGHEWARTGEAEIYVDAREMREVALGVIE